MKLAKLVIIMLTVIFAGCATVVKGTVQDLQVNTNPPGLIAKIGDKQCITPCTLSEVSRRTENIEINAYGTETKHKLDRTFNFIFVVFGNVWNAVIPGMIIDFNTGASRELIPVEIRFGLYATWAQQLSNAGKSTITMEDVSMLVGAPPVKCDSIDLDTIVELEVTKRPKEAKQCYWDVNAGYIAQSSGGSYIGKYGGSSSQFGSEHQRFFRAACRLYDGRAVSCKSNWQE